MSNTIPTPEATGAAHNHKNFTCQRCYDSAAKIAKLTETLHIVDANMTVETPQVVRDAFARATEQPPDETGGAS